MAGYLGTKAVLLSTTAADVIGNAEIGGSLTVGGNLTSTGIDVTGTVTADGLTVDGNALVKSGNTLTLNRADNSIGGAMSYVAGTGFIFNDANGDGTSFNVGATNRMRIDSAGRVTMPYQPAWFAAGSAGFFTTSPGGVIPLAAVPLNVGNHYSTSGSKFTAPVSGTYQINLMAYMESTEQIVLKKNGADYIPTGGDTAFLLYPNSSAGHAASASGIVYLNANDYIQMGARNNQSVYLYTGHTSFSGYLIG